jgi:hypothetical protein
MLEKLFAVVLVLTVVLFVADWIVGSKNKKNMAGEAE